jgi:uncharacterized protein
MIEKCLKLFFITILCAFIMGCATYGSKVEQVQKNLAEGKYADAMKKLEKTKSGRSKFLYLVEKGTILHYASKYKESNDVFEQAEILAEDLYTKSISKEAGALFTSDNILSYSGEKYERVLIHYYRAFNYIYLDLLDDALVECRKVNLLLQKIQDESEGKTTAYFDDAFMQYLTGIIFEWQGELNDALISYKKADEAYEKYAKEYNVNPPSSLKYDLLRLSKALDFMEDYEYYQKKFNITAKQSSEYTDEKESADLVMIYENGFAPIKDAEEILIPILKTDKLDEKRDIMSYSAELGGRANRHYEETQLEYMLRISIPKYISTRPAISYMVMKTDGIQITSEMAEDVEAIAFKNFGERMPRILLKTIARNITKYLTYKTAKKKQGEGLGFLVNILNIATESADTRSWLSLPNNFQIIRTAIPPGKYNIQLIFYDSKGRQVKSDNIPDIEIEKDDFAFLYYRTFK